MILELNDENFVMYAMKHYDNPSCKGIDEFEDDLKRFRYLKRLFRKYTAGKGLKERLIINHLVIIYNLFGAEAATKMLFFKVEERYWSQLKTFLVFLNFFPVGITIYHNGKITEGYNIPLDDNVSNALKRI